MHAPKYDPETYHPQQSYSARQLSRYDMEVAGVVVYVVALTMLFVVALVFMLFANENATQARAQVAKASTTQECDKASQFARPISKSAALALDGNGSIANAHAGQPLSAHARN